MYKHTVLIVSIMGVALLIGGVFYAEGSAIVASATNHWCGLFVKDSSGSPIANLAVTLLTYGTYTYSTDQNGYTGKIWSTGMSNGCPGGLSGIEIPASVLYHNTQYATYLKADQNVTLTLGS